MERRNMIPEYYSRQRDDRFGQRLKECGQVVYGIESNPAAAKVAGSVLDQVYVGRVEEWDMAAGDEFFDLIIFGDVLEHLIDPWGLLARMKRYLKRDGMVISSIPNLQYFPIIFNLIIGRFEYGMDGILDRSHLRFFTMRETRKLFFDAGYTIVGVPRIFPYKKKWARDLAAVLDFVSFGIFRNYLTGQIYIAAKKA